MVLTRPHLADQIVFIERRDAFVGISERQLLRPSEV